MNNCENRDKYILVRYVEKDRLDKILAEQYPYNPRDEIHRETVDVYFAIQNCYRTDVALIKKISELIGIHYDNCPATTQHVHIKHREHGNGMYDMLMVSASISIFEIKKNPGKYFPL